MIVRRFTGSRLLSERAERWAQVLVAIQFFLLAPCITYEALDALIPASTPTRAGSGSGWRRRAWR